MWYSVKGTVKVTRECGCEGCGGLHEERIGVAETVQGWDEAEAMERTLTGVWASGADITGVEWASEPVVTALPEDQVMRMIGAPMLL